MSIWLYRLYGLIFHCLRVFPVKEKKAFFFMIHDCHFQGNIRYVHDACAAEYPQIRRVVISKKQLFDTTGKRGIRKCLKRLSGVLSFYFVVNYHMATSHYIFLNDNFLPMAYMNFSKKTKLVQVWHGPGALKRFGLDSEKNPLVRKLVSKGNLRVDYIPVTADYIIPIFHSAMGVPTPSIFNDGVPLMDFYFDEERKQKAREHVYETYPSLVGKKMVFYAPTFRTDPVKNNQILSHFDCERFVRELGEEYVLVVRFHPQVPPAMPAVWPKGVINATDFDDNKALFVASDFMITDYSCSSVEYALLNKPILFFCYDIDDFDRGSYMDYYKFPGGVLKTMDEVLEGIRNPEKQLANADYFVKAHYDCTMSYGYSSRLLKWLMNQ